MQNWEEIAVWLADCQAATTAHLASLKSSSKSELRRHSNICREVIGQIEKGLPVLRPSDKQRVIDRLKDAVARAAQQSKGEQV